MSGELFLVKVYNRGSSRNEIFGTTRQLSANLGHQVIR